MTIDTWLRHSKTTLQTAGITTARLDALVLLADEIDRDKSWVLAHPEYVLQIEQLEKLNTKITQRLKHVPLAYIRGHAEFYGRDFIVNKHVLVPRSESESMIELLKNVLDSSQPAIIDVGTGSGCLAITAKLETPLADVTAIDISQDGLETADANARKLGATVRFLRGDLLQPVRGSGYTASGMIILANLPYVPEDYPINDAARHEPRIALFGGKDGLDLYRTLFSQAKAIDISRMIIITESLKEQHQALTTIAKEAGFTLQNSDGLAQLFAKSTL